MDRVDVSEEPSQYLSVSSAGISVLDSVQSLLRASGGLGDG